MDVKDLRTPSEQVREALLFKPDQVDLEAISQSFVKLAGGADAVAKMLHDEFEAAPAGSPTRARIMDMILRAFTKLDGKYAPADLSELSDADLQDAMLGQMMRMGINGHSGHAAGGKEETGRPQEEGTIT